MMNRYLSADEYGDLGLSVDEGVALWEWVFCHVGYLLGGDGTGGSGVFVRDTEGAVALLTAAHVVMPRVLQGQIWLGAYNDKRIGVSGEELRVARFRPAASVRVSVRSDAALVYASHDLVVPTALDLADWDARGQADASSGTHVIAAGMLGAWKAPPNLATRTIDQSGTLLLWTESKNVYAAEGLLECKAIRTIGDLPTSYAGMSGGPLFTLDRRLLGIIESETTPEHEGALLVTQRAQWDDLIHGAKPRSAPNDITAECLSCEFDLSFGTDSPTSAQLRAQMFWSPSDVHYGGYGRIFLILLDRTDSVRARFMNLDWLFCCENNHDARKRQRALEEQVAPVTQWIRRHVEGLT